MIVIDCSAMVEGLISATRAGTTARKYLAQERLAAPNLLDTEVASALFSLARGSRGGEPELAAAQLDTAISSYRQLTIHRYDVLPLWPRLRELSANLSVYDATYVALAEALDATLITTDVRIDRSGAPRCEVTVIED